MATLLVFSAGCEKSNGVRGPTSVDAYSPGMADLCPYKTPEEWQKFLDRYADDQRWVKTCEDSTCDAAFYKFVKENVRDTFKDCAHFISQHNDIAQCTDNLYRFSGAWMQQHSDDTYGFTVDNHVYLGAQDAADRPSGMMKPPEAIVAALPDRQKVELAARRNGWRYLTHDSALGGFRTFVVIADPAGRFDQWMLLNLQKGDSAVKAGTPMSLISVQKKDAAGNTLPRVRIHFRDYTISRSGAAYKLELHETNNGKCYSCHASGMRQLIARHTPILEGRPVKGEAGYDENEDANVLSDDDFAYVRLMELNKRIRSYGMPDWEGRVNPADHGPPLGEAQGCLECHNGQSRGILTVSSSINQVAQKLYHELSMPPDTNLPRWIERRDMGNPALSVSEQHALSSAFKLHEDLIRDFAASRFPALKKWMLETKCYKGAVDL